MRQIFGWTGPTPVGVGYARYLQIFDLEGLTRFVIRDGAGVEHHIDIPRGAAAEVGQAIRNMSGGPPAERTLQT